MAFRKVKGRIYKGSTPWKNAVVRFQLENGSYTSDIQYPSYSQVVKADETGYLEVNLWTNEEGEELSSYLCTLPDSNSFNFTVPIGDSDLDLSVLRQGAISEPSPEYNTIKNYIELRLSQVSGIVPIREILNPINQPNFSLTITPTYPDKSDFFINGLRQVYGIDYNINGSILQWLAGYVIPEDWQLELRYF